MSTGVLGRQGPLRDQDRVSPAEAWQRSSRPRERRGLHSQRLAAGAAAPRSGLGRGVAPLAILLALVLGLLVIVERQRVADPYLVEGALPPLETALDQRLREREALLAEQARLVEALAPTQEALRSIESEVGYLAKEAAQVRDRLDAEARQSGALAERLAGVVDDRDRLAAAVDRLLASQEALAARLEAIETANAAAAGSTSGDDGVPSSEAAEDVGDAAGTPQAATGGVGGVGGEAGGAAAGAGRFLTFGNGPNTVGQGVEAYRAGDYQLAARIWGSLAADGDRRGQFYLGSLLFEGRLGPPDRVMAYVWLDRAAEAGYLPAIEMRRRVRALMSDEEFERAQAIQSNS
jgi:TPR repeat protein